MDGRFFLNNLWRRSANMKEIEIQKSGRTLPYLRATQWNDDFESMMRNRLVMGAIRYGLLGEKNKPQYDRVSEIQKRLKKYRDTGNLEFLVDIANLALCEFVEGKHPNRHFKSSDDKEHVKKIK